MGIGGGFLGALKGFDQAVGASGGTQSIDADQQKKAAEKQQKIQMQMAPLTQASQNLQGQLSPLIDPETGKPRQGYEARYNEIHDQLADVIGKQRMLLNPPPKEDAHGLGYLIHAATDKAHITRHAVAQAQQAAKDKADAYKKATGDQVAETVQGIPGSQLDPSESAQAARIKAGVEAKVAPAPGSKPVPETSDTRARKDFDDFKKSNPDYKGSFEQWKTEQSTAGRKSSAGLKYDTATGQAIDQTTGKRFNAGDPSNPPEVNAMIGGARQIQAKKEALQQRLVAMRGSIYNATKPMIVLDSNNGNAPTVTTFADMQKQPGRYVPAGEADKAIAKENLMQDIAGTSQATRGAINNLKQDFPESMKVKIAAAMRADDPHASLDQLIASNALGSLTPDQQDFLVATRQLAENAMAMRSILGAGQGSDDVRHAITATLPSLLSPDRAFALKQLNAFDATINRLHRGVPNVKLNDTAMAPQTPQGPKAQSLQHKVGDKKTFPNGKKGVWDGTGWVAQP
jgi:hypothetical protein